MRRDPSAEPISRALVAASDGLQLPWLVDPGIVMQAELREIIRAFLTEC